MRDSARLVVLGCVLGFAGCGGGGSDDGAASPAGGVTGGSGGGGAPPQDNPVLVLNRWEIEYNIMDSLGSMTPDPLGFLRPGESLQVWGFAGGSTLAGATDAFSVSFDRDAEVTVTLALVPDSGLPPGVPGLPFDPNRTLAVAVYNSTDNRFDFDVSGSLVALGQTQAWLNISGEVRVFVQAGDTLALGAWSPAGDAAGPYSIVIEAR